MPDVPSALPVPPLREQRCTLAGVPALVTSLAEPEAAAARGAVLVLHGLTAAKEVQHIESHSLARHGYLAVALDAAGHGERRLADFAERFSTPERGERSFFELVSQTAAELPGVVAALRERGWAHPGRLGAVGISMGGFILLGAVVSRCPLDAVVAIVASPRWRGATPQGQSPHQRLDQFFPTPLLMITGSADETVPPGDARQLAAELAPHYQPDPSRLRYLEHAGEGHMFSKAVWDATWGETLAWFERFSAAKLTGD